MDDKTFENYQKRMLDAIQNPKQKSNDTFTKLFNILENLKVSVNTVHYSQSRFKQEVEKHFNTVDSSDETAKHFKKTLTDFCSTKSESLKTISELEAIVKPLSEHICSWSAVASIATECMTEIEKSIFQK